MKHLVLSAIVFAHIITKAYGKTEQFCGHTRCLCYERHIADCSYKNLTIIPHGLPSTIWKILLSGNNFKELKDITFKPLLGLNVKHLALDRCHIENMSSFAFKTLPHLRFLDLSFNNLSFDIINTAISRLGRSDLKVLNISGNTQGSRSPGEIFSAKWLRGVRELVMQNMKVQILNFASFRFLTELRKLDLSNNALISTELWSLPSLHEINFSNNFFEETPQFCPHHGVEDPYFPNLTRLYFTHNRLSQTYYFILDGKCLPKLIYLDVSYNPIRVMISNSFITLHKLKTLMIDHLLELGIKMENRSLASDGLEKLSIGSMTMGNVEDFNFRFAFNDCPSLKLLRIMNVNFSAFTGEDFTDMLLPLNKLRSLFIIKSEIRHVPYLQNLPKLRNLNLNFNKINVVHAKEFQNLPELVKISLVDNQLITISRESLPELLWEKKKLFIDVSFNPFNCDCEIEWFRKWLKNNTKRVMKYPQGYICKTPQEWKGRFLAEFQPKGCNLPNQYVVLAFSVCGFLSIIIFSSVVIRKLRWDIKYYIHILKNRNNSGYTQIRDHETETEYDGFVAYNCRDRRWVMAELVEHLERKHDYRLFLHERNLLPGGIQIEDIHTSIDTSRKFILVLSNNFMTDHWCQYEATVAKDSLAGGHGDKIVVIVLENLHSKHITSSFKTLLKYTDNAEWTENANGQKLFWKNVVDFMKK